MVTNFGGGAIVHNKKPNHCEKAPFSEMGHLLLYYIKYVQPTNNRNIYTNKIRDHRSQSAGQTVHSRSCLFVLSTHGHGDVVDVQNSPVENMSVKAIQKMWLATCDDIADVRLRERVQQQLEPETKPLRAHRTFAALFARYVRIVNRLGDLYDQTLQVQKRTVVRRVLESATQRLVELQTELKAIEMSEFVYIDRTLIEEKYTVEEVQLLVPFYYPMVRPPAAQALIEGRGVRAEPAARRAVNRAAAVEGGAEEGGAGEAGDGAEEEEEEQAAEVVPKTMIQMLLEEQRRLAELEANRVDPWADAIRLLQVHEKAR